VNEYERATALREREIAEAFALRDQAASKARWWRRQIAAGRIDAGRDLAWLLRDLEVAGGIR
jgi:hypothetical protein